MSQLLLTRLGYAAGLTVVAFTTALWGQGLGESCTFVVVCCALQLYSTCTEAASALSRLWKQSAHAKLLQRTPTGQVSNKQLQLFQHSSQLTRDLVHAAAKTHTVCVSSAEQCDIGPEQRLLLEHTFAAKPVAVLSKLLVWLQQQPDLLHLPALAADSSSSSSGSSGGNAAVCYGELWLDTTTGRFHQTPHIPSLQGARRTMSSCHVDWYMSMWCTVRGSWRAPQQHT
jgi:hypothetical protein